MNFDPAWIQYEAEQDRREQYQDEMAVQWDIAKQQLSQLIDEFGWFEIHCFVQSQRTGFTGTLPNGRELFDGLSIN